MNHYSGKSYFFCGVGGSGMSALAKVLLSKGATVYGSDRNYDAGRFPEHFDNLKNKGVNLKSQDGSGINPTIDYLVVSSAVETSIPDVRAAQDLNVPIIKRAELLAEICNNAQSICVAGTNGKSTVTGMIGYILHESGFDPTIINGGGMLNFNRDNAVIGQSDMIVAETDESDGTVALFHPHIAVLTNISEDHKSLDELLSIFKTFLSQSDIQILNADCPNIMKLTPEFPNAILYSNNEKMDLSVPGYHNQSNAHAALVVTQQLEIEKSKAIKSLKSFHGITSRLEVIGHKNGVTVIDDFAHNPDKIAASLKTLKEEGRHLILMYQPHGFKPMREQKDALIAVFKTCLDKEDLFYMPEILYFGGTVDKDVSSEDVINLLKKDGYNAFYIPSKSDIQQEILNRARSGDTICIMGARDDSLREMAKKIYKSL